MRKTTFALAVAAGFAATPVLACPMMNQASVQTTGSTATSSPMMCGAQPTAAQTQAPGQTTQPAQPGQSTAAGSCPCCRNMAMMQPQPGQPGGMGNMPGMQNMPGMPASPPATPTPTPETPRPN